MLFAIGSLGTGGSERQLIELLVNLPRARFDPRAGDERRRRGGRRTRAGRCGPRGIPVISSRAIARRHAVTRWARRALRYVGLLRAIKPDLVYAWLDETAAFLAPICRAQGHPVPGRAPQRDRIDDRTSVIRPRRRAIHWAEARATLVTANSAAGAEVCVARGHRPRSGPDRRPTGIGRRLPLPPPPSPPGRVRLRRAVSSREGPSSVDRRARAYAEWGLAGRSGRRWAAAAGDRGARATGAAR